MENKVTKNALYELRRNEHLSEQAFEKSLQIANLLPDRKAWQQFINYSSLFLGTALVLSGIIFFFAYNWEGLHKFGKLAIVEFAVLICAVGALYKGLDNIIGKILLLSACIFVGGVLAVFGQVYQTGADVYELFIGWSALIAGWVFISRFGALWFFWLLLINIGLILRFAQLYPYENFSGSPAISLVLLAINFGALGLWEIFHLKGWDWLKDRWAPSVICGAIHFMIATNVMSVIFDDKHIIFVFIYIAFIVGTFLFYLYQQKDLFMLTMNCMSLIFVVTALTIKVIKLGNNFDFGWFLFLSILVIGQAATAGYWLRKVMHSWKNI